MDTEKQIKRIVLDRMERCSVCHSNFADDDIQVLSRRDDMWMMVVTCAECHGRNFVAAVLGDGDPNQAQLALRRLSEDRREEATGGDWDEAPEPGPPITLDDVIEMHEYLKGFDGDFRRLFRED